jgi:hypothetical protein
VDFRLRYNIASRSHVPVLVSENGQTTLKRMRWGLPPPRAKAETIGDKLTNIRADTISPNGELRKNLRRPSISADLPAASSGLGAINRCLALKLFKQFAAPSSPE